MARISTRILGLSIALVFGCVGEDVAEQDSSTTSLTIGTVSHALNANPQIKDFAVYAKNSVMVSDRAEVEGADIGVQLAGTGPFLKDGYELGFSHQARADESRSVLANRVFLIDGSIVGDVQTNDLYAQGATHGSVTSWIDMPAFPDAHSVSPGTEDITVWAGLARTIDEGQYAEVTVDGVLTVTGGVVEMSNLTVHAVGRIEVLAPTELRVSGQISIGDRTYVGPASGISLLAGDLRIESSGINGTGGGLYEWPRAVQIGNDASIRATFLAPNGTVVLGHRTILTGVLLGRDVLVDNDSILVFESGLCIPEDCDTGNPCTEETCDIGSCVSINLPDGTECSDGNPNNGMETCDGTGTCVGAEEPETRGLYDFTLYSIEKSDLGDLVVTDGIVGSAGEVEIGAAATVNGNVESGGTVLLREGSVVDGDVTAAGAVNFSDPADYTVTGTLSADTPVALPDIATKAVAWSSKTVVLNAGQSLTLSPGNYDEVIAQPGSTLTLSSGTYSMRRFIMESSTVNLNVEGGAGQIRVNVKDELGFGTNQVMALVGGDNPRRVQFYSNAVGQIAIGDNTAFVGFVTAPQAEVRVFFGAIIHGGLYANRVILEPDSSVIEAPRSCGDGIVDVPVEACDDGNNDNEDGCDNECQVVSACSPCVDPANPCLRSFCNEHTGNCLTVPNDGVPCEDGDPTTTEEICVRAVCRPPESAGSSDVTYHDDLLAGAEPYSDHIIDGVAIYQDDLTVRADPLTPSPTDAVEIPIVFHVLMNNIYDEQWGELSDERIYTELDVLNDDFASFIPEDISPVFRRVASTSRFQFVPARRDPDCNELTTPGIHRVQNVDTYDSQPELGINPEYAASDQADDDAGDFDGKAFGTPGWPPDRYLNVWIVPIMQGYAGLFAPGAEGISGLDGVTVHLKEVVRPQSYHTLTHEVAHWLGVREHVNEDATCAAASGVEEIDPETQEPYLPCERYGDFLCDTPTSSSSEDVWGICPQEEPWQDYCIDNTEVYYWNNVHDQNENYLVSQTAACRSMFTFGQVGLMNAWMFADGGGSSKNLILGSNAALPHQDTPDLWSKDGPGDVGAEWNWDTEVMWTSSDIWVRTIDDGREIQIHENPVYRSLEEGSPNYVYVRVRNRGCGDAPVDGVNVTLYWAKASLGLSWPAPWTNTDGVLGGEIGSQNIAEVAESLVIPGGGSVIIPFEWNPPNPADYEQYGLEKSHFCLLAHIGAPPLDIGNPLASYETLPEMVRALNDVVWKNVSIVTDDDLSTDVVISGGSSGDENGIRVDDVVDGTPGSVFDWARVKLDLGTELLARWQDYGSEGIDLELDASTGLIELKNAGAEIRGLPITEDEFFGVRVLFEPKASSDAPQKTGLDVYQLDLHQTVYPTYEPIGTQRIQVKTRIPLPVIIIVE